MTSRNGTGALESIRKLETSLEARAAAAQAADGRVATARAEAEALLAAARVAGEREAERRREAIVEKAHEEAAVVREEAGEEARALRVRCEAARDSLADELCEVVLSGEGA